MSLGRRLEQGDFASTFPARFSSAMDRARGVMAGLQSGLGGEGADLEALARLHEIYKLRVELELETAGILWRTAEVVCALTDAATVLTDRERGIGDTARALREAGDRRRRAGMPPRGPIGAGRPSPSWGAGTPAARTVHPTATGPGSKPRRRRSLLCTSVPPESGRAPEPSGAGTLNRRGRWADD